MPATDIPFGYVKGPYYTYTLSVWRKNVIVPIYVGRGRKRRIMSYYRLSLRSGRNRYNFPNCHNAGLNAEIAAVRARGKEVMPLGFDHGSDLAAAKAHEKLLIAQHGRLHLGTGTLYNLNAGG